MTKKLHQNQQEKVKTGSWWLSQDKILAFLFYLLILFLPTQVGKHFWPNFSFVFGLRLDYLSPTLYLTDLIIISLVIFYSSKFKAALVKVNKKNLVIFGIFLASLIIGIIGSKNPLAGFYGLVKFLEFSFLTFFTLNNFKLFNKQILLGGFLVGIIFESCLSFLQYFNQGSIGGIFYFFGERAFNAQTPGIANASINGQLFLRPYATFSHPNVLAGFLIISMLYMCIYFKNKLYLLIGLFMGTLSLLLTLSRTAIILWIAYAFILFGISFVKKYKNRFSKLKLATGVGAFLILASLIFLLFQNLFILQRIIQTTITESALTQRIALTEQSATMFLGHPIFGIGINNFFDNIIIANVRTSTLLIQPVHNIFLLILSETGLIGFCFLAYIFYMCLKILRKESLVRENKYLFLLIFTVIFLGMFDHYFLTLQQGQIMFSIIFGTVLYYRKT